METANDCGSELAARTTTAAVTYEYVFSLHVYLDSVSLYM